MLGQRKNETIDALAQRLQREITESIETYRAALKRLDWEFEFADDSRAYNLGRVEFARLTVLQRNLDPRATIWNSMAPRRHRRVLQCVLKPG